MPLRIPEADRNFRPVADAGYRLASRPNAIFSLLLCFWLSVSLEAFAQEEILRTQRLPPTGPAPSREVPAIRTAGAQPLPIDLPTALRLGHVRGLDVVLASQRMQSAAAQLDQSRVLWLPNLYLGTDYYRHDGQVQAIQGNVFGASKSSVMAGAGPSAVVSLGDAIFAPLASRQVLEARQAGVQTAVNDTLLAVSQAYFDVQQSRGELAGALDALRRSEDLLGRVDKLAPDLVPRLEVSRSRTDVARRRQVVSAAENNWRVASARLIRVLHLDPTLVVYPVEPPHLNVELVKIDQSIQELVALGLVSRPELAGQQALVRALLEQRRQEQWRPYLPTLAARGASTPVTGTLAAGYYGGGINGSLNNFGMRQDWDVQMLWQLQNLGYGNRALVRQRDADQRATQTDFFRLQDQITEEIVQTLSQAQTAADRAHQAEAEVKNGQESVADNLLGLTQTRQAGNVVMLLVRPQEVVAAIAALGQAYTDYYGAIADSNRAQFRLYRALGRPGQALLTDPCATLKPDHGGVAPVEVLPRLGNE